MSDWFDWTGSTPEELADELFGKRPAPPPEGEIDELDRPDA